MVAVSLGGPFKDSFVSNVANADVVVCLLTDETDIDSKQMVERTTFVLFIVVRIQSFLQIAIKKNGKASESAAKIWEATYKYNPVP